MVRENRTVTVHILAYVLNNNKSTCHQILWEDLGTWRLNARLVLHTFTQDQNVERTSVYADLLHEAQSNSTFVNSIIVEDKSWYFQYDP
jgi:hypothetical protein